MKFTRTVRIQAHVRPDKHPDGPEIAGILKITSPQSITDSDLNKAVAQAMRSMKNQGTEQTPLDSFAWALYGAAHKLWKYTWDIEVIQPGATVIAAQKIDDCASLREITIHVRSESEPVMDAFMDA